MIAYSSWPACCKSYHMKAKTTKKIPKCKTRQKNKITLSNTTKYELLFLMDWTQFWQILKVKSQNKNCGVLNFPKMQRNIARISALAFKMGQIKKIKAFIILNGI